MNRELFYGLMTGILFGFFLQRALVLRYDKQVGALLLKDMTIVKFMLSAVIVGMAGLYFLKDFGIVQLQVKAAVLGSNILGGLIFGIGWALLGYCPGTQLGALGEGRWDSLWGIIGMLCGSALYAEAYPLLKNTVLKWGVLGKITIPDVVGVNPWIIISIAIPAVMLLFYWLENRKL